MRLFKIELTDDDDSKAVLSNTSAIRWLLSPRFRSRFEEDADFRAKHADERPF